MMRLRTILADNTHGGGSTLFVTTGSIETLKVTMFGVTSFCCPPLPVPKVTPKIVRQNNKCLTIQLHYTSKVETTIRARTHRLEAPTERAHYSQFS